MPAAMPGPCRLGRVHELGEQLVVACAVVGPVTSAPAARSRAGCAPQRGVGSAERTALADRLPESFCTCRCNAGSQPGRCRKRAVIVSSTVPASPSRQRGRARRSRRTVSARLEAGVGVILSLYFSFLCRSRCSGRSGRACSGMLCVCLGTAVIQLWTRCGRARRPPAEPPAWSGAGRGDLGSRGAPLSGSRPAR